MSRLDLHSDQLGAGCSFMDRYRNICEREGVSVFRPVLAKLAKDCLEVNLDVISRNDLIAVLHALVQDDTLVSVRFESRLLRDNPQLTTDLRKIHLHHHSDGTGRRLPAYVEREVMVSLCNALCRHIGRNELNLKVLRLNGLPLADEDLATISGAFQMSKSLHLLSLEGVPLSCRHLDVLLPVLPLMQSLTILNLAQCHLGRAETLRLSRYLQADRRLERIILNGNPIGDTGVEHLVRALRHNTAFRALDLQNCGLTSAGCLSLQYLLNDNRSIEVCDIRRNTAVCRNSALTIAKILLENNKYRRGGNTYRPLAIDMSPPIDAREVVLEGSGLDGARHNLPPREVPSVKLPPKDLQLPTHGEGNAAKRETAVPDFQPGKDGMFMSKELLSKFESSLIKFQVLLDYLESEHLEKPFELLGRGGTQSGLRASSTKADQRCPDNGSGRSADGPPEPLNAEAPPKSHTSASASDNGTSAPRSASVESVPHVATAAPTHRDNRESTSTSKGKESNSRKSYSDSFTGSRSSSSTRSTKRNTTPASAGTRDERVADVAQTSSHSSSSTTTPTRSGSTVKKTSSKVVSPKRQLQSDVDEKENDRTITSDPDFGNDSFEFNFADLGGITKESSYMKLADEIFNDRKEVLESTRTSGATSRSSRASSKFASPTSKETNTDTNVDELQERLRTIQSKYNVVAAPLRSVGSAVADGTKAEQSNHLQESKRRTRLDDFSISDSWAVELSGGGAKVSIEVSDASLGSSYSGDFTGSDLDKF